MENKYIYVCSPYGGQKENYERAVVYGRYVAARGGIPVIPHTMLHGVLDDNNPDERQRALKAGKDMLKHCAEVWVFGKKENASIGMRGEIETAAELGIPVRYIDGGAALAPDERATAISRCLRHYEQTYCGINRAIAEDIIYYLDRGIEDKLVCRCIDAAAKRQAHWNYSAAILRRCLSENIATLERFCERQSGGGTPGKYSYAAYDLELFEKMLNGD